MKGFVARALETIAQAKASGDWARLVTFVTENVDRRLPKQVMTALGDAPTTVLAYAAEVSERCAAAFEADKPKKTLPEAVLEIAASASTPTIFVITDGVSAEPAQAPQGERKPRHRHHEDRKASRPPLDVRAAGKRIAAAAYRAETREEAFEVERAIEEILAALGRNKERLHNLLHGAHASAPQTQPTERAATPAPATAAQAAPAGDHPQKSGERRPRRRRNRRGGEKRAETERQVSRQEPAAMPKVPVFATSGEQGGESPFAALAALKAPPHDDATAA